jgi:outer membrane protein OmpA-like peptidoglycan-associated protein
MAEPLNSNENEGAGCISQDGRILYFTACGRPDGAGRCDLYLSYRKEGGWSRPQNLGPAVNTGGWESQPCLSIDGQTLYFVSDRKDGLGGMDIWRSTLVEGRWSQPVNMGPGINTAGDEKSPFVSFDDQTLYFSSNGRVCMGGMDLFMCRRTGDSTWSEPQNLGYPINTRGDESSLIVSPDGSTAIFSSDKFGGQGQLDLYSFALPETVRPEPVVYKEEITEVAPELKVGESITLKNVFFQTGKYTLLDISIVELDKVVEMMQQHPTMRIELGGHTDNVGSEAMNQKLSEQRAKAVYDYLVQHGVAAERLSYKGYGPSQPVADNSTPEGRRQNRRTVFTIIEK